MSTISASALMLGLTFAMGAQTPANDRAGQSATESVKGFYLEYLPRARSQSVDALELTMKQWGALFASELKRPLLEDMEAQAKAQGVIVGLDFDPFLSGQDRCESYDVGAAVRKGDRYGVEVFSTCQGRRSVGPTVIAEVRRLKGHWVFTNFQYPLLKTDLLSVLSSLRKDRARDAK